MKHLFKHVEVKYCLVKKFQFSANLSCFAAHVRHRVMMCGSDKSFEIINLQPIFCIWHHFLYSGFMVYTKFI